MMNRFRKLLAATFVAAAVTLGAADVSSAALYASTMSPSAAATGTVESDAAMLFWVAYTIIAISLFGLLFGASKLAERYLAKWDRELAAAKQRHARAVRESVELGA